MWEGGLTPEARAKLSELVDRPDVTIVEMAPQLLPLEDEASAKVLQRVFRRRGIAFELDTPFQSVSHTDDGVSVTLGNGKHEDMEAETLLVAVGRKPLTENIGIEGTKVELDRGFINGAEIGRLKRDHGIDTVIPIRSDMNLQEDVRGLMKLPTTCPVAGSTRLPASF